MKAETETHTVGFDVNIRKTVRRNSIKAVKIKNVANKPVVLLSFTGFKKDNHVR